MHLFCNDGDINQRPEPGVIVLSQKMGFHDWVYDSHINDEERHIVPLAEKKKALKDRMMEVELGFDAEVGYEEAMRCLNCDVQTVFDEARCIECDACTDVCPTNCINFIDNGDEDDLRSRITFPAKNAEQDLYVSAELKTTRVMVKDEDVCLHCGLCAERCPTAAWDMQKFLYTVTKAG